MSNLAVLGGRKVGKMSIPEWPIFDENDIQSVTKVIRSGVWAYDGPNLRGLEKNFTEFCKSKYCVCSANGSVALRLALEALEVGPGDEVIVPGLTWQATASAALDVNAVPILVDIDPETYTIDPQKIEEAITTRTKCIIPVHLYGRMADMDAIMSIANKYKLYVIEDTSHQHGSIWKDKPAGSIGDVGTFSLQSSKILNSGEGGLIITQNKRYYELLMSLVSCGRKLNDDSPTMQSGNYRLTEFQAAIALTQLSRLDEHNKIREANARYIEDGIADIKGLRPMYRNPNITFQTYYNFTLRYDQSQWNDVHRDVFIRALSAELENEDIGLYETYEPLNSSPLYQPHSKKTHKLNDEYWKQIDPRRFDLPVCKKASDIYGDVDIDDYCNFMAELENGISATYNITRFAYGRDNYQRIEIYGDKGSIIYNLDEEDTLQVCIGEIYRKAKSFQYISIPEEFDCKQIGSFIKVLQGESDDMVPTIEDGYMNQLVIDSIIESMQKEKWISII